ncbi:MAG: 1,4-dihydroxy-6-naphthoate synthase [Bacteroidales bacterium]|nr:1,4-dihydroxy-6-naphthoate synthase [Bacteroidales bacterium]
MNTKLTLGFSSCPNDTFMFDAMIHHKIDTEGLDFELFIGDIEELNRKAFASELDITKISFNAFTQLTDTYKLLTSGAALGENCGPLLVAKRPISESQFASCSLAIPGFNTTANLLTSYLFPDLTAKSELLFSSIEQAVIDGHVDLGLIIHESRFTYESKGLVKIADVGEVWEKKTGTPTPLGGIIIKNSLDIETQRKVNRVLEKSVRFAFANPTSGLDFIRQHAFEMSDEVMFKHIQLYVNEFSINFGEAGRSAIIQLFDVAAQLKKISIIPPLHQIIVS